MGRVGQLVPSWQRLRDSRATPGDVLAFFGYEAPPVDPFWVASRLGIRLYATTDPEQDGEFSFDSDGVPAIYINPEHSPNRQRFTCAHELGHIVLGHPPRKRDRVSARGIQPLEIAANQFAADLLMPKNWVRAYRYVVPDRRLPEVFKVSEQAMGFRLQGL